MSTDQTASSISLPVRLDRSCAIDLKAQLDAHLGGDLMIDGSGLESIGGLGLQLLHLALHHWTKMGWTLEIVAPSEPLSEALSWLTKNDPEQFGEFA